MLAWDSTLPKPYDGGYSQSTRSLSGGQSLSGFEQVQAQQLDRWMASFSFFLRTPAQIATFGAMLTRLRGRANSIGLPMFDRSSAPWVVDTYGRTLNPKFARDKNLDGTVYADSSTLIDDLIVSTVAVAALVNATTLRIAMTTGSAPLPGHRFSLGNRLYSINTATFVSGVLYDLEIWPWLRAGVSIGAAVDFTSPLCEMRLASDNEGADALRSMKLRRNGTVTLNFDEVAVVS